MAPNQPRIDVVRGKLDAEREQELLAFWAERRALSGEQARDRLPEVVCTLRLEDQIVGANSVFAADVPLIGGRRFWVYRSLLDPEVADEGPAMIRETFNALAAEFSGGPDEPIGLCLLIGDPQELRRRPEVEWSDPRMIYAGYTDDGRQMRIAYFENALITRVGAYA